MHQGLGDLGGPLILQLLLPQFVHSEPISPAWMDCALWVWQRVMSIPQMGNPEFVAQVTLHPLPTTLSSTFLLPTLAQSSGQT